MRSRKDGDANSVAHDGLHQHKCEQRGDPKSFSDASLRCKKKKKKPGKFSRAPFPSISPSKWKRAFIFSNDGSSFIKPSIETPAWLRFEGQMLENRAVERFPVILRKFL